MKPESQTNITTQDKDNLSEQEKMNALVAELAGETEDKVNSDPENNDDDSKSEEVDNIKNDNEKEIDQKTADISEANKDNLSEQEKMNALVAELAGETGDKVNNDPENNDDDSKSEAVDNIKNDNEKEIDQKTDDDSDANKDNFSEQAKIDTLIVENSDKLNNTVNNDLKDDESKSEPVDNIKNNVSKDINQKNNNSDNNIDTLLKKEEINKDNESDDFHALDDEELESFDSINSTEIADKKVAKTDKNDNINTHIEKKKTEGKVKINKIKKQITVKINSNLLISLFLLLILFFSAWFIYKYKTEKNNSLTEKHQSTNNQNTKKNKALTTAKIKEPEFQENKITQPDLADTLAKLELLINKLQETKNMLDTLSGSYKDRIKDVEIKINEERKRKNIKTFKNAIKNIKIKLGLKTIQRRIFYIKELEKPYNQLICNIEELIYLKRKAKIAIQIIPIINQKEIEKFKKNIKTVLIKHISVTDTLFIDNNKTANKLESLESIWASLPYDTKTKNSKKSNKLTNIEIWKQLSNDNFSNVNKLTQLSLASAEFLSKWKGKDLYLNKITKLSPEIAKKLIKWKGEWLCLNGLKSLSPDTAKYLFMWKGKHISLNSIKKLSDKEAEYISTWHGNQLELINLTRFSPKAAEYLNLWFASGGILYNNDIYNNKTK